MSLIKGIAHVALLTAVSLLIIGCGPGQDPESPDTGVDEPASVQEVELAVVEAIEEFGEARAARLVDGELTVTIWEGDDAISADDLDDIRAVAEEAAGVQADRIEIIISDEDPP